MKTEELAELIKSRRSIRAWEKKPVSEDTLLKAIELATYAPNGGNQQNWRFYIILNKITIVDVADVVQESANYFASWPEASMHADLVTRMLQRSSFFRDAPALIALLLPSTNRR